MNGSPCHVSVSSGRSAMSPLSPNVTRRAEPGRSTPRSDGTTATASGPLPAERVQLRLAVRDERAVAVEVVGREVEQHAPRRARTRSCPRAGRRTPRRRPSSSGAISPTSDATAMPTLPATATGSPASRWTWPIQLGRRRLAVRPRHRDEVVRQHPPGQLQLSHQRDPARARRLHDRRRVRNAWALDERPDAVEQMIALVIQVHFDARVAQASRRRARPASTPTTRSPRARSASAAATPLRASPTTRYGPPGRGGR